MSKNLYIILLENEKYFIYYTETTDHDKLFFECVFMFSYLKTNKPIKIIDTIWSIDMFDVDKTVKKYMAKYGINNVRGGSYQSEKLTYIQESVLRQEIQYVNATGDINNNPSLELEGKMRYFVYNELFYVLIKYDSNNDLYIQLLQKIKNQKEKYENTHEKLSKILWARDYNIENHEKNISYLLDKTLIEKIQYLQKYIVELKFVNETQNGPNREIIQLFKELIIYFNHFNRIFQENDLSLSDFTKEDINLVFISHPEFIFSPYVHLSRYNQSMSFLVNDIKINEVNEICKIFEGICYWSLNRIDEYEFDLKSIPENIKLKSEMVDYLLKFHEYDISNA